MIVGATFVGPGVQELLHSATVAIAGEVTLDHAVARRAVVPDRQRGLASAARGVRAVSEGLAFGNLLAVALIAVAAPLIARMIPLIKVPAVVLEIVAGIIVGPSVLGWVEIDQPVTVLALVGVAFLLFLAGLEIDLLQLRGELLRLTLIGFAVTLVLGVGVGYGFDAAGWVHNPLFLAIALSATSLGLVVPVLKDAGLADRPVGQYTIAGATVADFGAVLLLSFLFSEAEGGAASRVFAVAMFAVVIAAVAIALTAPNGTGASAASSSPSRTRPPRSGCASRSPCSSASSPSPRRSGWRPSSVLSSPAP